MDTSVFVILTLLITVVQGQNETKSTQNEDKFNISSSSNNVSSFTVTSVTPVIIPIIKPKDGKSRQVVPVTVLQDNRPLVIIPCEMNTVTSTMNNSEELAKVQCINHDGKLITLREFDPRTQTQTINIDQSSRDKPAQLDMKSLAIIVVGYVAFLCVIAIVGVAGVLVIACQHSVHRHNRCQAGYQTIV